MVLKIPSVPDTSLEVTSLEVACSGDQNCKYEGEGQSTSVWCVLLVICGGMGCLTPCADIFFLFPLAATTSSRGFVYKIPDTFSS